MDFGIFMEFEIRRGGDQTTAFREGFDVVDAAEAWGLDGVWLGEMHFTPARSVLSRADRGGELDRDAHQAPADRDGRPGASAEQSIAHRRRGRDS